MSDALWRTELGFVDSIWPMIKKAIDGSIFAVDTSSPGVEGALKVAADIALTKWRTAQVVPQPNREALRDVIATAIIERDGYAMVTLTERIADAVIAHLSAQPVEGEVEWQSEDGDKTTDLDLAKRWAAEGSSLFKRTVSPWVEVQP